MYEPLEVQKDIYWVGALDRDIRTFDIVMYTEYGTTYNSYIVKGSDKTAIIEASKDKFFEEHMERIKEVTDPKNIDYLIVNHTEPDHTGAVEKILEVTPDITVVGSASAIKFLKEITNMEFKSMVVKDGDILDLGGKTLKFLSVPFLHWPDSMYTYVEEEKVLFTCDSFGCHYCDDKVFNDLIDGDFIDAYKYYFDCIMGPFKSFVLKALDRISDIEINTICPGHGPVLRKDINKYLDLYREWSIVNIENKVIVAYASAYGYTKKLAMAIAEGVEKTGLEVKIYDLETADKDEMLADVYTAKGLLLGSPTIVNDAVPPIWAALAGLNPTINKGLAAGAFGSYGWSGEAVDNIEGRFAQLKFKVPVKGLKVMFNPSEEQLQLGVNFGKEFGNAIK